MTGQKYTAKEALDIKMAFAYFIALTLTLCTAEGFLIAARVPIQELLQVMSVCIFCIILSFIYYTLKKNKKDSKSIPWILSFITVAMPIAQKLKYAKAFGWTFTLLSYNSSMLITLMIFFSCLFLREKLFISISLTTITIWSFILYYALNHGAVYSWDMVVDGKNYLGVIPGREIFMIISAFIISYVTFRWIRMINTYVNTSTAQQFEIEKRIAQMHSMNIETKDSVATLLNEVDSQNGLVVKFNEKMQSQAATFEEISATLEELRVSAESIHNTTLEQIDGNMKMDDIVSDFKTIKNETKVNLNSTYSGLNSISEKNKCSKHKAPGC